MQSREHRSKGSHGGWSLFFGAVGAIAAVLALLPALQGSSQSKTPPTALRSDVRTSMDVDSVVRARQQDLNRGISGGRYEAVYVIRQQKGFVDAETGFAFTAVDISTVYPSFLGPSWADGILSYYKLPDGTVGRMHRRAPGERIDFSVDGRRFFAAVEDVDYKLKIATIRIREVARR